MRISDETRSIVRKLVMGGRTQQDVAEICGISHGAVSAIITGHWAKSRSEGIEFAELATPVRCKCGGLVNLSPCPACLAIANKKNSQLTSVAEQV